MKGVDTIARVRREHLVRHRSIREISRDLHLSRNAVRKILRSEPPRDCWRLVVLALTVTGAWAPNVRFVHTRIWVAAGGQTKTLPRHHDGGFEYLNSGGRCRLQPGCGHRVAAGSAVDKVNMVTG